MQLGGRDEALADGQLGELVMVVANFAEITECAGDVCDFVALDHELPGVHALGLIEKLVDAGGAVQWHLV